MAGQTYTYRTSARIVSIITITMARLPTLRKLLGSHSEDGRPVRHGATTITMAILIYLFLAMRSSIRITLRSRAMAEFRRNFVSFGWSESFAGRGACRERG